MSRIYAARVTIRIAIYAAPRTVRAAIHTRARTVYAATRTIILNFTRAAVCTELSLAAKFQLLNFA